VEDVFHKPQDLCGLVAAQGAGLVPARLPYRAIPDFWYSKQFEAAKAAEDRVSRALLRDLFGNPFRKVKFDKRWRTDTAVALAQHMYESRDFGVMPILADALQDAGCDSEDILAHCRSNGPHVRGCWVVDLVLGKG
jgi:hypothetical protein